MESKLAIFGGVKSVEDGAHFVWPPISYKTKEQVIKQMNESVSIYDNSGIIGRLEGKFSEYHGRKHALLTSSGTAALHSLFVSAGLKAGDEVICPVYTFYATVTPILFTGAVPVFVDCKEDGNIDPVEIEKKITDKTKAIMITHMWGRPCDMEPILKIAKEKNLILFEDSSHAVGAEYRGKKVGSFGDIAAFSMQAQKNVAAGEGGVLLTDNDEFFYRALLFGHYNKRCKKEIPLDHKLQKFSTTGMGLKLRIHPLAAAIAEEQFENLGNILNNRRRIAKKMIEEFGKIKGITVPKISSEINPAWYAFLMQYKSEELGGLSIEKFYEALVAEGCKELDRPMSTSPLNLLPLFQNPEEIFPNYQFKYASGQFPIAEKFYKNAFKLPVWHDENGERILDQYIKAFKKVVEHHEELLKMEKIDFNLLASNAKSEGINRFVVGAVVLNNDNVLLLKRPKDDFMGGIFELPSGKVEENEDLAKALFREVEEETALKISQISSYLNSFDYVSGSGKKTRQFNFVVNVKSPIKVALTEHDEFAWVPRKDIEKYNVTDSVKEVLSLFWQKI